MFTLTDKCFIQNLMAGPVCCDQLRLVIYFIIINLFKIEFNSNGAEDKMDQSHHRDFPRACHVLANKGLYTFLSETEQ